MNLQIWEDFRQFEYANELMIAVGGLLVLIGVFKILRSSLKVVFWVLLSAIGLASTSYGLKEAGYDMPFGEEFNLTAYLNSGKALSNDALAVLCTKLDEAAAEAEEPPENMSEMQLQ